jgi:hypothetical protein
MALTDPHQLREWLGDVDYPAGKEHLVAAAQAGGAPQEVVAALRTIPPVEYANRSEVLASVPVAEGQSDSEKAKEDRAPNQSGLAEGAREVSTNPIVEELGENRGS